MPIRVLLVVDNIELAYLTSRLLERDGIFVECVGDHIQAIEESNRGRYDGIILDLDLPRLYGLSVCRELVHRTGVPILVVDGSNGQTAGRRPLCDYIREPFTSDELLSRIRAAVRRGPRRPEAGPC